MIILKTKMLGNFCSAIEHRQLKNRLDYMNCVKILYNRIDNKNY